MLSISPKTNDNNLIIREIKLYDLNKMFINFHYSDGLFIMKSQHDRSQNVTRLLSNSDKHVITFLCQHNGLIRCLNCEII